MLFTGLGRSVLTKLYPLSRVRPSAWGLGLHSRPRAQFFPIRTSRPVNNINVSYVTYSMAIWLLTSFTLQQQLLILLAIVVSNSSGASIELKYCILLLCQLVKLYHYENKKNS